MIKILWKKILTVIACFLVEDSRVANVSSVEEVQQGEPTAKWQYPDVQATVELLVACLIIDNLAGKIRDLSWELFFRIEDRQQDSRSDDPYVSFYD